MSFPYTYKKDLTYLPNELKDENINSSDIIQLISKHIKYEKIETNSETKNTIKYIDKAPIFNFKYSCEIVAVVKKNEIIISYEINLEKLIRIILVLIILTAFFSFLSVTYFLILSGVLSLSIYTVIFLSIEHKIQNLIRKSLSRYMILSDHTENLSEEQQKWMNDENRCSACGENLSEFDLNCPDCGIKLNRNKYTIPLDTTNYQGKQVNYHLKDKK